MNNVPMFQNRLLPTSGVGVDVSQFPNAYDALYNGNVNWELETMPCFDECGTASRDWRFVRRNDTRQVFGVVKEGYRPAQPKAVFPTLTEPLLANGCVLDKLGAYKGGEIVWMNLSMPERTILGEPYKPYIFIIAGNNGKQAVSVKFSLIRAWCCNMLSLVTKNQFFNVTISHKGNLEFKFSEASAILAQATKYWNEMEERFLDLRKREIERKELLHFIEELIPVPNGKELDALTQRSREDLASKRNRLYLIYRNAPDLQNENENGYRFLNAVADYESHLIPSRKVDGWRERNLLHMVNEKSMVDTAYRLLTAA